MRYMNEAMDEMFGIVFWMIGFMFGLTIRAVKFFWDELFNRPPRDGGFTTPREAKRFGNK